jgi:hypothetical protein
MQTYSALPGLIFAILIVHHCRNTRENRVDVAFASLAHIIFASIWFKKMGD